MHYYQFNIGDYKSHTEHLSDMEDLTYRRLLDWYYLHESPIPLDLDEVARQIRMRTHSECIAIVLREYFIQTDGGWIHGRADKEIAKMGDKSAKAAESAKKRWEKDANAMRTHSEGNATHNTVHITQDTQHKTQKNTAQDKPAISPRKKKIEKTGLPENFGISERVRDWASEKRFDRLDEHLDAFRRKATAKAYSYASWDDAFMEAIREDWAKLRSQQARASPTGETAYQRSKRELWEAATGRNSSNFITEVHDVATFAVGR